MKSWDCCLQELPLMGEQNSRQEGASGRRLKREVVRKHSIYIIRPCSEM
jgi:hypothetical protein